MQPWELSRTEAAAAIEARDLSPVELTESVLARAATVQTATNAFVTVTSDLARKAASTAEREIAEGRHRGPLHGIPFAVKDLFDTAGVASTSSSRVRADHVPDDDAVMVARMRDAGMVMIGKTHTHEFAYGGVTPESRNPWDTSRIPGGSSGGSGAAVAGGACTVATGSDPAGSIRIPASFCGTVGFKPTYGRASRRGVASLSWSLDHVGPLTRNVTDAALVMDVVAGFDRRDPATVDVPVPSHAAGIDDGIDGLRVGVPTNWFFDHVEPAVEQAVRRAIGVLEDRGATLVDVTIPHADEIISAEWAILLPEASAYHRQDLRAKGELYTDDVRLLLEVGELVLATDYITALRVRTLMQQAWAAMFADIDVLAAPCMVMRAPAVGQADVTWPDGHTEDITTAIVRLTSAGNLTGLPTLSLPVGVDDDGLPLGMQLMGRPFDDPTVLRAGRAYEVASDTVGRIAPL